MGEYTRPKIPNLPDLDFAISNEVIEILNMSFKGGCPANP